MKAKSVFFVSSTHKTKTWWTFLSVFLFVFVPFLIVWLLCCEFNLLGHDWFIAKNASVWHGTVEASNIPNLVAKYGKFYNGDLAAELSKFAESGVQGSIDAYKLFFNPVVLAPLFGLLVWSIIYPIIFNATKVSGLDVLPFSVGIATIMFATIISGLIPHWGQKLAALYWITRLFIGLACTVLTFMLTNYCVNKFLANRPYAVDIYFGYKQADKNTAAEREQLKENVDIYKQHKDQEPDYVEIEEGK